MAFIEGRDFFPALRNSARFCLLIPESGAAGADAVLTLLPVRRGGAADWVRYTGIELLARQRNLAVIMPEGIGSDFCNMVYGMRWWDYLTQELPEYLRSVFGFPAGPGLCFGAEMGGEASIRLALRCPDRFVAAGAVGADYLRVSRYAAGEITDRDLVSVYGDRPVDEQMLNQTDPLRLARAASLSDTALWLCPGDAGAEPLAQSYRGPVHWLSPASEGWPAYARCLEEFIDDTLQD